MSVFVSLMCFFMVLFVLYAILYFFSECVGEFVCVGVMVCECDVFSLLCVVGILFCCFCL